LGQITHVAFMVGGVLVPRMMDVTLELLHSSSEVDRHTKFDIHFLERDLSLGRITPEEYCRQAIKCTDSTDEPSYMMHAIPEQIRLVPGMKALVDELAEKCMTCLVSDYPRLWLKRIWENTGLSSLLTDDRTLILAEANIPDTYPELFQIVMHTFETRPGSALWIDYSSPRTSWAIRQGIDAIVFVDEGRLRRELEMRTLLTTAIRS